MNMRSLADAGGYTRPFWFETRRERPQVFFGHTVLREPFAVTGELLVEATDR